MEKLISGNEALENIKNEIKGNVKNYIIRPSVAVIDITDSEESIPYIKLQEEICNEVGIYFRHYKFETETSELTIINKIKELNNDDYVNAIEVVLPVPEKFNEKRIINTISNSKDVDGLTDINVGRLISGRKTMINCCSQAVIQALKDNEIPLEGKHVVLVGNGRIIGRSLITLLLNEGATLTICNSKTKELKEYTIQADVLISAVGKKDIIKEPMVKEGATVIDLGCDVIDGKEYGDVSYNKVSKKAYAITAQKQGIGTYTLAMFLKNIITCHDNKK